MSQLKKRYVGGIALVLLGFCLSLAFGAATDTFNTYQSGLDSPAVHAVLITTSDSTDQTNAYRAIYNGSTSASDVKVTTVGGETLVISSVPSGAILPVRVTRVWSTSTTDTAHWVGLY